MISNVGVSIAIPIYNAEKYLEDAIKSVIFQKYEKWELFLINDGSIDQSMQIAKKYVQLDSRIKIIDDGVNKRLPYRLNQIVELSNFDYIARMDADDIMHPDRLLIQMHYILGNDVDLVSTSYYTINKDNNIIDRRLFDIKNFSKEIFIKGNYFICHPSVLVKKDWLVRNKYNNKYDRAEDYELWLRATLNNDFKAHVIPDFLMFYREDGSVNKSKLINSYKTTLLIFKDYRANFSILQFIYIYIRNFLKISLVNVLYSEKFEKLLIKKRSHSRFGDSIEAKNINQEIFKWLNMNNSKD